MVTHAPPLHVAALYRWRRRQRRKRCVKSNVSCIEGQRYHYEGTDTGNIWEGNHEHNLKVVAFGRKIKNRVCLRESSDDLPSF